MLPLTSLLPSRVLIRTAQENGQHEIEDDMLNKSFQRNVNHQNFARLRYPLPKSSVYEAENPAKIKDIISKISQNTPKVYRLASQSIQSRISQPSSGDWKVCFSFITV